MPPPDSLEPIIAAALPRLPAVMADRRARAALLDVARRLPASLARGPLGFEIRLAGPTVVDLFAAAVPGDATFAALIDSLADRAAWQDPELATHLGTVLTRWQHREGALPAVARYLLVELDAPVDPAGVPAVPSIFLAPRGAHDVPRPGAPPNAFHRHTDATVMATAELSGVWPDPATAAALARVVSAIPDHGEVFAVGAMTSRAAGASVRVAVRRLTPDGMRQVLVAAGLPYQADIIAGHAEASGAARQVIAFEVGPGAESRVGLELSPVQDWKAASADGWPDLLDELSRQGLGAPERMASVLDLIDRDGDPLWGLAHVKVAADEAGMMPGSKLYVGLLHR